MSINSICVFCASSRDTPTDLLSLATQMGEALANRGIRLIYGGAAIGMMGAVADGALGAGGEVIGVIPEKLMIKEVAHDSLTELIVTTDMHTRKMKMHDLSDGYICLPGGLGTLEETLEVLAWKSLGIHIKPVIILNHDGFFDHLLKQFKRATDNAVMSKEVDKLWLLTNTAEEAMDSLMPNNP